MEANECINSSNSDMDLNLEEESNNRENYLNEMSSMPAQMDKNLEFITANKNGHILLGSSNLTGRYWCGSIWYYTDPSLVPDIEGSKAALEFHAGVTDCVFIDEKRAIIGQDGGVIDFVTIKNTDNSVAIERTEQIEDHGYAVVCVKLTCNANTAITASLDMGIRLWDCHTTACTHNFTPAHTQEVTSVSPHPHHPEMFLSSSLDGNVFLWDLRSPRPASCVFRDIDKCPSAVAWTPSDFSDSFKYVVGTLSGEIHLRDAKVISHSQFSSQPFKRPIYRIAPNRFRLDEIAVCANETKVQVFAIKDEMMKRSYCDDRHADFVRGLEWLDESSLMSCGWDKQVFRHSIISGKNAAPELPFF